METVKSLLADDPAMLMRESLGIAADASNKAFPSADVDRFLDRQRVGVQVDILDTTGGANTKHFVLAVDPSGGGSSAFAVASMIQMPTGQIVVRYCALLLLLPPPCSRRSGQLPSGSPSHSSLSTHASTTNESGHWQLLRTYRGSMNGSTRSRMSSE